MTRLDFFILSSSRVPRDLHSFPTRRSSDLATRWRFPKPGKPNTMQHGNSDRSYNDSSNTKMRSALPLACKASGGDRKSTRLNSSHTVISYAVFCLKKKNRREKLARRIMQKT